VAYQILFNGQPWDREESLVRSMNAQPCVFAPHDPETCEVVFERLRGAARRGGFLTYAALVRGVTFRVRDSEGVLGPYVIDADLLRAKDEAIILDFGRYIGAATYRDSKVLLNALLVPDARRGRPADAFFTWAMSIGLPLGDPRLRVWDGTRYAREVAKIQQAYRA